MKSIGVAIFVKTPGHSPLKTRLAKTIGERKSLEFYEESYRAVSDIVAEFASLESRVRIQPYFAVAEKDCLKDVRWQKFPTVAQGEGDLGNRLSAVSDFLLSQHNGVIFLGSDSPQITVDTLEQAITSLISRSFVIGPARDGGFYLFGSYGVKRLGFWNDITYSSSSTLRELRECIANIGGKPLELETMDDVDVEADLAKIYAVLQRRHSPNQTHIFRWLSSFFQNRPLS